MLRPIDINVNMLMLRALVKENLQAVCYGGTNFHNDNKLTADIAEGTITFNKQFTIKQSNIVQKANTCPPSRILANATTLSVGRSGGQHQVEHPGGRRDQAEPPG